MHLDGLKRFELTSADAHALDAEFSLLASTVILHSLDKAALRPAVPALSGCYFWIARIESQRYKIYIGRTTSIRKRLTDYANNFQVHSPNDYKLRLFQDICDRSLPSAAFDLHFAAVPADQSKAKETKLVQEFGPLMNTLPRPTKLEREGVRSAFEAYYRSVIARHLAAGR